MELTNDFRVGVPVEQAWAVLTDVELIAPCMPGAQLQEVEGDEYRGIVGLEPFERGQQRRCGVTVDRVVSFRALDGDERR